LLCRFKQAPAGRGKSLGSPFAHDLAFRDTGRPEPVGVKGEYSPRASAGRPQSLIKPESDYTKTPGKEKAVRTRCCVFFELHELSRGREGGTSAQAPGDMPSF
jgi:hypothetical protein